MAINASKFTGKPVEQAVMPMNTTERIQKKPSWTMRLAAPLFGMLAFAAILVRPVAASWLNATEIATKVGDVFDALTPVAPKANAFMDAWFDPAVGAIIFLVIVGLLFVGRDKIENWAKKI